MTRARIAIVGAGVIGARHARLAQSESGCDLVALADPSPAADALGQELGVRMFRDHREMLDVARPEGVIVSTPNELHGPVGIDCARAGAHLLVEKPITDTLESGLALLEAADAAGVAVAAGHHRRFDPAVARARELIGSGAIGKLLAVQCLWSLRKDDAYYQAAWRTRRPGGGPVLLNCIHDVDLLRHLCGEIVRVHAESSSASRGNLVEDTVVIALRFASGALGTITACDAAPSPWGWEQATGENPIVPRTGRNPYRLMGTRGALGFPRLDLWQHDDVETGSWLDPLECTPEPIGDRASLAAQLEHFCRVVRGEEPPRVEGRDALATLAATVAILDSAAHGEPVEPTWVGLGS